MKGLLALALVLLGIAAFAGTRGNNPKYEVGQTVRTISGAQGPVAQRIFNQGTWFYRVQQHVGFVREADVQAVA